MAAYKSVRVRISGLVVTPTNDSPLFDPPEAG